MSVPITAPLINVMAQCVLYGIYVVIFGLAIWTMPQKFNVPSVKKFLFPIIIALFVITTIDIAYDLVLEAYAILYTTSNLTKRPWMIAGLIINEIAFIISDILGDIVLFYRVYAVWGFRKRILFPLALILFVAKASIIIFGVCYANSDFSIGFLEIKMLVTFTAVNAFANISMTLLIAGRIWWISRALQMECTSGLKPGPPRPWHHKTIAIIIESGVIYPIALIVDTGLQLPATSLATISVGLAPTLIAVRVGLGSTYDNQLLSTMGPSAITFSLHNDPQRSTNYVLEEALVSSRSIAEDASPSSVKDAHGKLTEVV
ncbi:hypothetical protein GYMLUDRAFT_249599 [Collybiopsis luxurians FD-317 M1]|uniref:Uncharacterized protein n=1 Tax=Collybiopsis luxurians FD-317 M1 TaxID=944289 RepID=A0A0D0C931_9AGAR|nr:hypothetical protein GYMLUDRAFT_249599 [Collybiopsis luxurians FD-317 M1]